MALGLSLRGLDATGEMAGGIFHFNYPRGLRLANGAGFARIAFRHASARRAPASAQAIA